MNRYIIRIRDTDLWMKTNTIYTGHMYSSSESSFTWVTSPLEATRYANLKEANEMAEKGIPKRHWTLHRLLDLTEPVYEFNSIPPAVERNEVTYVSKPCWFIRKLCGG
jgi:hypothetical protein